jgi:hypothetical protein
MFVIRKQAIVPNAKLAGKETDALKVGLFSLTIPV